MLSGVFSSCKFLLQPECRLPVFFVCFRVYFEDFLEGLSVSSRWKFEAITGL